MHLRFWSSADGSIGLSGPEFPCCDRVEFIQPVVSESSPNPEDVHTRASIETPSTYFGNSPMSEVYPKELRATIRDLHLVRLQKALGTPPAQSSANLKLKSMISITDASSILCLCSAVLQVGI
jgi:hypothetical protein